MLESNLLHMGFAMREVSVEITHSLISDVLRMREIWLHYTLYRAIVL